MLIGKKKFNSKDIDPKKKHPNITSRLIHDTLIQKKSVNDFP